VRLGPNRYDNASEGSMLTAIRAPQLWIVLLTAIGALFDLPGWALVPAGTLALVIAGWRSASEVNVDQQVGRADLRWLEQLVATSVLASILAHLAGHLAGS